MDILLLARELRAVADLVVTDEHGHSVLLVEIEAESGRRASRLDQLREHQRRFHFPFAMLADPAQIWLLGSDESADPVAWFSTPETLKAYRSIHTDPNFRTKDDIYLPLQIWLRASTEEFLTNRHEGHC